MEDSDAVSCLLCLQADEYGSMIRVCVPPGRIPPSAEKVICRLCAAMIASVLDSREGEEVGNVRLDETTVRGDGSAEPARRGDGDPDWDRGLPERAGQSVVEVDRSEPPNATDSSKERSAGRVASGKTDD